MMQSAQFQSGVLTSWGALQIVARVKVGPRPVHSYGVPSAQEFWTHSDDEATFDVIHLDAPNKLKAENVPVW